MQTLTRSQLLRFSLGAICLISCSSVRQNICDEYVASEKPSIPRGKVSEKTTHERTQKIRLVKSVMMKYAPKSKHNPEMASLIVDRSLRAGFDPLFVAAIIKAESTFRTHAVSNKGARGLMQVTPIAEREVLRRTGQRRNGRTITNPSYNLDLGLHYLRQLEKQFGGNKMIALVAYNCGPTRVLKALDGESKIPDESFRYARTIIDDHQVWANAGVRVG